MSVETINAFDDEVSCEDFFAPTNEDAIDMLLGQYASTRQTVEEVSSFMTGEKRLAGAKHFFHGQARLNDRHVPGDGRFFELEPAIRSLDAEFWQRALDLTDVFEHMPHARRREWQQQIHDLKCPPFKELDVRDNLNRLMADRAKFVAEKVDGIFTGLSGAHVTNKPEGFSKRMIIAHVCEPGSHFFYSGGKVGLIHDLRTVVAKLMRRDAPGHMATQAMAAHVRKTPGEWRWVDGYAFRIKLFKKGTAHLEVHPQIAWRLNQILSVLHPSAIPPVFRKAPKRHQCAAGVELFQRPIPFAVINLLNDGRFYDGKNTIVPVNTFSLWHTHRIDKHVKSAAIEVLEALGGVKHSDNCYQFDYNAETAIDDVLVSGMMPDRQSYQFYPTPDTIAEEVIEAADIGPEHRCLEPSAGQGALASRMPSGRTTLVEASALHCSILKAQGHDAVKADFLQWRDGIYDRVCMNPPYSQGRAHAHLDHAASMVAPGGRLVAVLPASFANKTILPGFDIQWSVIHENQFANASVNVVILIANRSD